MFSDRILELENSKTSRDSKGHSNADLAGAKALLELTKGNSSSSSSSSSSIDLRPAKGGRKATDLRPPRGYEDVPGYIYKEALYTRRHFKQERGCALQASFQLGPAAASCAKGRQHCGFDCESQEGCAVFS
jgi:hypothetical protein